MIIDLCCGKGRFDSKEDVISIDLNKKVKPTIQADIRFLPLKEDLKPRLCHASPPCTYLSYVRLFKGLGYSCLGIAQSLEIVAACFKAFDWLKPKMWTIENPKGVLNRVIPTNIKTEYSTKEHPHKKTHIWTNNEKALNRALIPQDVRQKILEASYEPIN